jgi:hypothetical protein
MSKWGLARGKTRRFAAFFAALAVALGAAVAVGGPAYASGQNCSDNGDEVLCINVNGASNIIHQIVGSATIDQSWASGDTGHVEVIDPSGDELCNSSEGPMTKGTSMSCLWHGYGETYETGDYCVVMWVYSYHGVFEGWRFQQDGPAECLNVFV